MNVVQKPNDEVDVDLYVQPEDIAIRSDSNYSLLLQPVDGQDDESRECVLSNSDSTTVILKLDCQLPPNRIWTYKLLEHDGSNSTVVLDNLKLSKLINIQWYDDTINFVGII